MSIYNTGYIIIKKTDDYENIYTVNSLYLTIGEVDGFIEEKNGSIYLVFLIEWDCISTDLFFNISKKY